MSAIDHHLYSGAYLIRGEDPEEFAALCEDYRRRFGPDSVETEFLVATLIHTEWRMRRYRKVEARLIAMSERTATRPYPPPELENKSYHLVRKQLASLDRGYQMNLRFLLKLQKERTRTSDPTGKTPKLGSFRQGPRYLVTPPPPKTRPN